MPCRVRAPERNPPPGAPGPFNLPHMHLDGQVDMPGLDEMIKLQQRLCH